MTQEMTVKNFRKEFLEKDLEEFLHMTKEMTLKNFMKLRNRCVRGVLDGVAMIRRLL